MNIATLVNQNTENRPQNAGWRSSRPIVQASSSVAAVAKRRGVSDQTIDTWRKRFGTFQADYVRRLKALEVENARLKKLVAERDLEIEVMKEIAAKKW